jgi:hypothetical protein
LSGRRACPGSGLLKLRLSVRKASPLDGLYSILTAC